MKYLSVLAIMLCTPAFGELAIDLPKTGVEHKNVEFTITTDKASVLVEINRTLFETAKVFELKSSKEGVRKYVFTGKPGRYLVKAIGFNPEIETASAVVMIKAEKPEQLPDEPDDPGEPDNPGTGDFSELAKLSKSLAAAMSDRPTQEMLREEYSKALDLIDGMSDLNKANAIVVEAFYAGIKRRTGASLRKNWLDGWLKKVTAKSKTYGIKDVASLKLMVSSIVESLAASDTSSVSSVSPMQASPQPTMTYLPAANFLPSRTIVQPATYQLIETSSAQPGGYFYQFYRQCRGLRCR